MTALPPPKTGHGRSLRRLLTAALLLLLLYVAASVGMFWRGVHYLEEMVQSGKLPESPYRDGRAKWRLHIRQTPAEGKAREGALEFHRAGESYGVILSMKGRKELPLSIWKTTADGYTLHAPGGVAFLADQADPAPVREAWLEASAMLPKRSFSTRFFVTLMAFPCLNPLAPSEVHTRWGKMRLYANGAPKSLELRMGTWAISLHSENDAVFPDFQRPEIRVIPVPGDELMLSLAEALRIGSYQLGTHSKRPASRPSNGVTHSGNGKMEVHDGHRQIYLSGSPYEIGFQHGMLAGQGAGEMARRLVYGVGLLYSIRQQTWFPTEARKLVERQRRFIHPDYFEEMRGLAKGAQLPLELVQMVNIFPEFFHCSGVALMGGATKDGSLLHARVLDYMVGVGLQDQAAVMAVERPGKNRFVTVGYLGFIGSVTGMNEHQVAIGEMGGAGQGDWDGIPMSLLIRQALEECDTLVEVEKFMRESPRTCEYYYVISDGKGPSALGIEATPEKFETFGPGELHPRLQQPVDDAVLLSGSGRYEKLVERVKADYGQIDRKKLIAILQRPVSMKSNLHNVIFEPQTLSLSVADASRSGPACNEPYRLYTWDALFSAAASR